MLIGRAGSSSPDARFEVTSALEHFAERGDRRVLTALIDRLEDAEGSVRARAISALSTVSEPDDDEVLVQVLGRLLDSEASVRAAVAEALPSLASQENRKVWTYLTQALRNFRPPPQREDLKEAACRALTKFVSHGDVEAIDLIAECIDAEYPQATVAALRALVEVAPCGDLNALEAAAKALGHQEVRTQEISMEVLERLADRGAEPASATVATAFEGSWTGAVIKGKKIFWNSDDLITEFEVKGRSIISTVCVDKKGCELPCWGRLNASGVLRWDFGAEWVRSQDGASTLPSLSPAAMTLPPPQDAGEVPASPSRTSEVDDAPALDQKVIGDAFAVAAVAAHFKSEDPAIRKTAIRALQRVAGKGCKPAIEVLMPLMQDEVADVRLAAVESLVMIAQKGDQTAIQALAVRLEDQEVSKDCPRGQSVGVRAAKALKRLATREELEEIAQGLKFQGPSLRGF